uniref:UCP2m n=1 Tax=Volvox carteri f. nagariensis TaxID=3068 RepID=D9CJ89_VOLCA|nr:UCP2m [Volvox carteri f. nagariensis]
MPYYLVIHQDIEGKNDRKATLWQELLISGRSVSVATIFTNPLDVVKTRMQLHRHRTPGIPLPGLVRRAPCGRGDFRTATSIVREGGIISLWKGLPPAVPRGFLYGGDRVQRKSTRLGLYGPCKDSLITGRQALAGDGVAAGVTSPTELVKTRLQAKGSRRQGTWGIVGNVVKKSGVAGLWRGAVPSMTRAALLTSSQVATYDLGKHEVMRQTGSGDCLPTFLAASLITVLVATTITNPVDLVKTRMLVAGADEGPDEGIGQTWLSFYGAGWSGLAGGCNQRMVALKILKHDGLYGFFKVRLVCNYARLGPQTVIPFLMSELLRQQMGLECL